MEYGGNPGPGRQEKNLAQSVADDIKAFIATEASTDNLPLLLEVENVLWSRAAKKGGNWYREVVDAAGRFMTKWHRTEADKSWPLHAKVGAKNKNQGKLEGGGGGVGRTDAAVDERRIEMAHGVARYRVD